MFKRTILSLVAISWLSACSGGAITSNPEDSGLGLDLVTSDLSKNDASQDATAPTDLKTPADTAADSSADTLPDTAVDVGADAVGPGGFNYPCGDADDCDSGYCVQSSDGLVCTKTCETSCPDGWACKQVLSAGDAVFICLPKFPTLCMPCKESGECQPLGSESFARCLPMGDEGAFCGGDCSNTPCPQGYTCQDQEDVLGEVTAQCVKDDGVCECSPLAVWKVAKTECGVSNDAGTCVGERVCLGAGLSECDGQEATLEVCDGADNNCDGSVDETFDCDDENPCTDDVCDGPNGCSNPPLAGAPCDDGKADTDGDICDAQGVCAGTPIGCPQASLCTPTYVIDDTGECVAQHAEAGVACDDGELTTQGDVCDGDGGCAGTDYTCPDATSCITSYSQDGEGCIPSYAELGAACDDGDNTTKADGCDGQGGCAGETYSCPEPTTCIPEYTQDGSECLAGYADPGTTCDDGSPDTSNDICDGLGGCYGSIIGCPDPTVCTPTYQKDGDGCLPEHADVGAQCNDGDDTTKSDVCDGLGGCAGEPYQCPEPSVCSPSYVQDGAGCVATYADMGTECDDGLDNTKEDACDGEGMCLGEPYACPDPTVCIPSHVQDGVECVPVYADFNALCNDEDPTTKDDGCDGAGLCVGDPYDCPEPTECTPSYTQDGAGCIANYAEVDSACDDKSAATKDDVCDGAGQCAGSAYECPAPTVCIPSYTQDGVDCVPSFADPGVGCSDQDNTTKEDVCDGSGGCAGSAYECPEVTPCILNYIKDGSGCLPEYGVDGLVCDDQDPSTKEDACNGQGGCLGTPYSCPEPTACTPSHTQDGSGCIPNHAESGAGCDDGNNGTNNDVCDGAGSCNGAPYECPGTDTCTPSYTQDGSGCIANYAAPGAGCDDSNSGTNNDVCDGAGSCSGTPYSCPAPTACTPGYTQDGSGCIPNYAGPGAGCDDGNNGTNNDVCDGAGSCSGTPYNCPGTDACTPSYTQDGSGCIPNYAGPGAGCDDGNNGTNNDVCNGAGSCSGTPYSCPGGSGCVAGYSQDGSGCNPIYTGPGVGCDDGNNGTNNDVCDGAGSCSGTPYGCPGTDACTPSYTQDGSGCIPNYAGPGAGCDDGNNGTNNDVCNGAGSCSGTPYSCPGGSGCVAGYSQDGSGCNPIYTGPGVGCDDGNNGTNNDVCDGAGSCSGTPYGCPGTDACTVGWFQDGSGCIPNYAGPGAGCNDGNNGTNNDVCDGSGSCSGTPYSCPGGSGCVAGYSQDGSGCNPIYVGPGVGCDDGNNGTKNDVCNGAGSCGGTPYGCPGGSTCTPSYSQDGSGCVANHAAPGSGCNDGNNGTKNDVCNGSGGCGGTPYSCPGASGCIAGYSQDGSGCVPSYATGQACNDGNNATKDDVCSGNGACSGTPYSCPGGTACTPSYTQNGSGCIANHAPPGTGCNDGNPGTSGDVCDGGGGCAGKAAVCGNGVVEAGEQCDGGACCTGSCTNVPNGTSCGAFDLLFPCLEQQCNGGVCGGAYDTCPWWQHCCEFIGCIDNNTFCP